MNTVVSLLLLIVCSSFKNTSDYAIAYYLLSNEYSIMAEPVIPGSRTTLIPVARAIYSIV